jgi:GT2 family glycosyltransferase
MFVTAGILAMTTCQWSSSLKPATVSFACRGRGPAIPCAWTVGVGDDHDMSTEMVKACIVNHNTSLFAELCLRSLYARNQDLLAQLAVTVSDNHSTDPGVGSLRRAAEEVGATFDVTRWPAREAYRQLPDGGAYGLNTHGDVLRDFVLSHPDPDYYLLLDADIVFTDDGALRTMIRELEATDELWAVQARFVHPERIRGRDTSLDMGAGDAHHLTVMFGHPDADWVATFPVVGSGQRRCHPGCVLVRNSDPFRRTAEQVGFATSVGMSADPALAGYYDTMALASKVMSTHGYRYTLSAAPVVHYFNVSYDDRTELTEAKRLDVERRLRTLRDDPTGVTDPGPWG